jgi:hypothetical protein
VGNIRDEVSMVVSVRNENAEHPQVRNQIRLSPQVAKSAPRNISWVFVDSSDMLGKGGLKKTRSMSGITTTSKEAANGNATTIT